MQINVIGERLVPDSVGLHALLRCGLPVLVLVRSERGSTPPARRRHDQVMHCRRSRWDGHLPTELLQTVVAAARRALCRLHRALLHHSVGHVLPWAIPRQRPTQISGAATLGAHCAVPQAVPGSLVIRRPIHPSHSHTVPIGGDVNSNEQHSQHTIHTPPNSTVDSRLSTAPSSHCSDSECRQSPRVLHECTQQSARQSQRIRENSALLRRLWKGSRTTDFRDVPVTFEFILVQELLVLFVIPHHL